MEWSTKPHIITKHHRRQFDAPSLDEMLTKLPPCRSCSLPAGEIHRGFPRLRSVQYFDACGFNLDLISRILDIDS